MSNPFERLGSRNKPPSLEALCEKVITAQELETASGLTILNMRKVLSSLTPDEFQVIGNKGPTRRYKLSIDGIERFRSEAAIILDGKKSPQINRKPKK